MNSLNLHTSQNNGGFNPYVSNLTGKSSGNLHRDLTLPGTGMNASWGVNDFSSEIGISLAAGRREKAARQEEKRRKKKPESLEERRKREEESNGIYQYNPQVEHGGRTAIIKKD